KEGDSADVINGKLAAAINDANLGIGISKDANGALQAIIRADSEGGVAVTGIEIEDTDSIATLATEVDFDALTPHTANTVKEIDISSAAGAQSAVLVIDDAIKQIDSQRAELGAVQNRFENTIANLQ